MLRAWIGGLDDGLLMQVEKDLRAMDVDLVDLDERPDLAIVHTSRLGRRALFDRNAVPHIALIVGDAEGLAEARRVVATAPAMPVAVLFADPEKDVTAVLEDAVARAYRLEAAQQVLKRASDQLGPMAPITTRSLCLDGLLATAPLGAMLLDPEGRVLAMNAAAETATGAKESEAIGSSVMDRLGLVESPGAVLDADAPADAVVRGLVVGSRGRQSRVEWHLRSTPTRPGSDVRLLLFWEAATTAPDGPDEATLAGLEQDVLHRIEERVRAETGSPQGQMDRHVHRLARLAGWRFDVVSRSMSWSPELAGIMGLAKDTFPSLDAMWSTVIADDRNKVQRAKRRAHRGLGFRVDFRVERHDGIRFLAAEAEAVGDDEQPVLVGTIQDITGRREHELKARELARRRIAQSEQQARTEAREQLLKVFAHQINTPLTPLKMQVTKIHRIADETDHAELARAAETIARNVDRLGHVIDDMVDAVRVHEGDIVRDQQVVAFDDIVRDVVAERDAMAKEADVGLALQVDPGQYLVTGDKERLAQVVDHLVANAIQHSPRGTVARLRIARLGQRIHLAVRDQGVGLSESDLANIWQPMADVHDDAGLGSGTGLGLYMSKGIIEGHGGRLMARSRGTGAGSIFVVELRAAEPTAPRPESNDPAPPTAPRPAPAQRAGALGGSTPSRVPDRSRDSAQAAGPGRRGG